MTAIMAMINTYLKMKPELDFPGFAPYKMLSIAPCAIPNVNMPNAQTALMNWSINSDCRLNKNNNRKLEAM